MKKTITNSKIFILLFVFAAGIFVSSGIEAKTGESYADKKKLTLNEQDITIQEALLKIQAQSEFDFFYKSMDLKQIQKKVSFSFEGKTIHEVLPTLLKNTKLTYKVMKKDIVIYPKKEKEKINLLNSEGEQQFRVTGKVTDTETGESVPGVNVTVQGTNTGTITDANGQYSLRLENPDEAVLIFSFVGYQRKTISVNGRNEINVTLKQSVTKLNEVVAVGYGTQQRADLTSSIATVSSEDVAEISPESVDQMIRGHASGISISPASGLPGSGSQIRIRGTGTINNTQPLIVIDGQTSRNYSNMQYNPLSMLNPNDIKSIQIMKSASATSIYGARAANGVILIETKKGTTDQAPSITYNGNVGFNQPWKTFEMLDAEEYVNYVRDIQEESDGGLPSKFDTDYVLQDRTDWIDEVYRNGMLTDHNLSIDGGGENSKYHVGLGYSNKSGHILGHNFERYSLQANSEFDFFDGHLTLGETFTASYVNVKETQIGGISAPGIPPYTPVKDPEDNNTNDFANVTTKEDLNDASNPIAKAELIDPQRHRTRVLTSLYGEFNFLNNFTFKSQFSVDLSGEYHMMYQKAHKDGNLNLESHLTEDYDWTLSPLIENTLTFKKDFGIHNLTVLAGNTYEFSRGRHLAVDGYNFPNDEVTLLTVASERNFITNAIESRQNALIGYFGRVNYILADKYLFTFNFRRDGSAKFAEKRRWGNFPSFSLGWKLHQEDFIKENFPAISQLKIRGGWGKAGNDLIDSYAYLSSIKKTNVHYILGTGQSLVRGATINSLSSSDIHWEETATMDVGIDIGLFENKYTASVNYYDKLTNGILIDVPIPPSLGYDGSPVVNEADVLNKGLEFSMGYRNMEGKFNFRINGNLTYNIKNGYVESLGQGEPIFRGSSDLIRNFTKTAEGLVIGSFYGYRVDKVYSTTEEVEQDNQMAQEKLNDPSAKYQPNASAGDIRFKDLNGDGHITEEDREVIGDPTPDFSYGLSGWFRYGNLDLSFTMQGIQGNDIFHKDMLWELGMSRPWNETTRVLDRWREEGDKTDWPRAVSGDPNNNNRPSDKYVEDGSFMRLRNLTIGYNFNNVMGNNRIRLFFTTKNLITLTNFSGIDPEVGGANLVRGVTGRNWGSSRGSAQHPRSFLLGVEAQF